MEPIIRIAFADDHNLVRKGIINGIEADGTVKAVIEAKDGEEMLERLLCADVLPDLCITDIHMPRMDGITLLKEIRKRWPEMKCLVFTAFEVEYYITEMIRAGANGYILKHCDAAEMIRAIHSIYNTGYYYSDQISNEIFERVKQNRKTELNEREIDLLHLICSDLSYTDIAAKMNISHKALCGIRDRLCIKLNINSRISLVMAAIQFGYYEIASGSDL
jgi:DNA-binding NarL/FixJ family response regulator